LEGFACGLVLGQKNDAGPYAILSSTSVLEETLAGVLPVLAVERDGSLAFNPGPVRVDERRESLLEGRPVCELGEVLHRSDDIRLLVRVDLPNLAPGHPRRADKRDLLLAVGDLDGDAVANGPLPVIAELEIGGVVVRMLRSRSEAVRPGDEAGLERHLLLHLEQELLVVAAPLPRCPLIHHEERERSCPRV